MNVRPVLLLLAGVAAAQPLQLSRSNPHYFEFRGKPTILITSGEHYGAVLNAGFDYVRYLDTLASQGLNMTRIFSGAYREVPGSFGIAENTLAPAEDRYLTPWRKIDGKYDLSQWNQAYFARLKDFIAQAGKRGIVVEFTLFTTYYSEVQWGLSPLNTGGLKSDEPLTMKDKRLVETESAMVRKIVTELKPFDNVFFEICNEPYFQGVTDEWQRHIAQVIHDADPSRIIAQNIANNTQVVRDPNPLVSLFNFHYARPPVAVAENSSLRGVIGYDESGFDGTDDAVYRTQAWDFILAGGGHFNNLDYSFTAGHEDGSFLVPGTQPGGGSKRLRDQLGGLQRFMSSFEFVRMRPAKDVIAAGVPDSGNARVLAEPGRQYAIYLHHAKLMPDYRPRYAVQTKAQRIALVLNLPKGAYVVRWFNPRAAKWEGEDQFTHEGGRKVLTSPDYAEDLALSITAR